ncbi:MAG: hypothetical protein AB8F95_18305, partial [Bacteroidia bacterium]
MDKNYYGSSSKDKVDLGMISPERPGAYVYDLVLGDSLKIDKMYSLFLKGKERIVTADFKIEDYVLEDAEYSLKTNTDSLYLGIPPLLTITAKAANGLPVMDGTAICKVSFNETFKESWDSLTRFPNVMYEDTFPLHRSGTTHVHLPDSALRYLGSSYTVNLYMRDGSGDLVEKNATIYLYEPSPKVHYHWLAGQLTIDSISWPLGWDKKAVDAEVFGQNIYKKLDALSLPHTFEFDPAMTHVMIDLGDYSKKISPPRFMLDADFEQKNDSLFFVMQNKIGVEVHYEFWQKGKMIQSGFGTHDLKLSIPKTHTKARMSYYWNGKTTEQNRRFHHFPKRLQLTLEQPQKAAPGDSVDVNLLLTDASGNPIPDADLTVWANHVRFGDLSMPKLRLGDDIAKQRFRYWESELKGLFPKSFGTEISLPWAQALGINQKPGYTIRFPDPVASYYHPLPKADSMIAAFAVHPFERFSRERPEIPTMIWLNNKLVFSSHVHQKGHYAILADSGSYTLRVRMRDFIYEFQNVKLKRGQKLEFSFDMDKCEKHTATEKAKPRLSKEEAAELNYRIVKIDVSTDSRFAYVSDGFRAWKQDNYSSGGRFIGPFFGTPKLYFIDPGKNVITERFEFGYKYSFKTHYLKLTSHRLFDAKYNRSIRSSRVDMGEFPMRLRDVPFDKESKIIYEPASVSVNAMEGEPSFVKLNLESENRHGFKRIWMLKDQRIWLFSRYTNHYTFPAGTYRFAIQHEKKGLAWVDIQLKEGFVHVLPIDSLTWETDTIEQAIENGNLFVQRHLSLGSADMELTVPELKGKVFWVNVFYKEFLAARIKAHSHQKILFNDLPGDSISITVNAEYDTTVWVKEVVLQKNTLNHVSEEGYVEAVSINGEKIGLVIHGSDEGAIEMKHALAGKVKGVMAESVNSRMRELERMKTDYERISSDIKRRKNVAHGDVISYASLTVAHGELTMVRNSDDLGDEFSYDDWDADGVPDLYDDIGIEDIYGADEDFIDVPELDSDGDGVADIYDKEPPSPAFGTPAPFLQVNGDGIPDTMDDSPATFNNILKLRSDFRDYAYWQPLLRTDAQGKASFRAVLPGQLTSWNSYGIAAAPDGRMAYVRGTIRAVQ